ncbi:hypothetical protein SOVF_017650 [Spinacia oleracea]|nr:hypothetical protein SOVF_017650 [Spinacia oleracea]
MGCFSCFESKEEERLNPSSGEKDDRKDAPPSSNSNISKLSSGADRVKARNNVGLRRESSISKDEPVANINSSAHTFTFRELAAATKNFRDECFIGEGGFGRVYKGQLETNQVVAVKQLDRNGLQGNREFLVEVLMLSLLHHVNLVNLIGYCADGDQRLLVYEYMALGSLEDHLFDFPPDKEPLDWNTRMKIAAGAAKGLEYLHDKANPPVIYRDFKSSNILLDEGFHPKLSDFGLAKLGPTGDKSHVSTRNLVAWARPLFNDRRKFLKLADPQLQSRFPTRGLYQALAVASMCIQENAAARPLIGDVVTALSYLANQAYDPSMKDRTSSRDENGGRITRGSEDGANSGRKWDLDGGSEKDDSPRETVRMLNKDSDRERAVAEAKMWGENWREKRRQTLDLEGGGGSSERDDSPKETARMLNRDSERERAVAEAKMWGENLREKRRQSAQGTNENSDG